MNEPARQCNGKSQFLACFGIFEACSCILPSSVRVTLVVSGEMAQNDTSRNERDFFRIVRFSTALGFGTLAAFLYSMKDIVHDPTLVFSPGTVVAFLVAAMAGWAFWSLLERRNRAKRK
jgi:hypothetical protein